jgi:hypothetical protein
MIVTAVTRARGVAARRSPRQSLDILTNNARHGGVNDLLPDVPGIRSGLPRSANGPGMMDQTSVQAASSAWKFEQRAASSLE